MTSVNSPSYKRSSQCFRRPEARAADSLSDILKKKSKIEEKKSWRSTKRIPTNILGEEGLLRPNISRAYGSVYRTALYSKRGGKNEGRAARGAVQGSIAHISNREEIGAKQQDTR